MGRVTFNNIILIVALIAIGYSASPPIWGGNL